jgi:hypothetical protein
MPGRHIESEGIAPASLTSAVDWEEQSASCSSSESAFRTHCVGGWEGLKAALDAMETIKIGYWKHH